MVDDMDALINEFRTSVNQTFDLLAAIVYLEFLAFCVVQGSENIEKLVYFLENYRFEVK